MPLRSFARPAYTLAGHFLSPPNWTAMNAVDSPVAAPIEGRALCRHYPDPWPQQLSSAAQVGVSGSIKRTRAIAGIVRAMHAAGLCEPPGPAGIEWDGRE